MEPTPPSSDNEYDEDEEMQEEEEDGGKYKTMNNMGPAIMEHLDEPARLIVTGRSTVGKTTLAVDIILTRIMSRVRRCFAVCPTFYEQHALAPLRNVPGAFPKRRVFTSVDDSVFDTIFHKLSSKPCPTLLFVDDAAAEAATNKGNKGTFSRLCLAAPHLQLYIVGVFQRLTAASPALRDNAEGLISFIASKEQDVQVILDEFNPSPAVKETKNWIIKTVNYAWQNDRFLFIWRESYTGKMHFYTGLHSEITQPNLM